MYDQTIYTEVVHYYKDWTNVITINVTAGQFIEGKRELHRIYILKLHEILRDVVRAS